ncbi:MAG: UDP-glucose/GDP-mannose dehydrogenase family protein [Deltaproteobacteria bacterium]|nr:UDP-glucose/GDP-mannose dehydrogenase family protein [Deltaproteobacteria bacterium]
MQVAVIGLGYVGLVLAVGLGGLGHQVLGVDADSSRIAVLARGEIPLHEPGLAEHLARHRDHLRFSERVDDRLAEAQVVFVAVGTPPGVTGDADLSAVFRVAEAVGARLRRGAVVVIKSTVPVGTGARVEAILRRVAGFSIPVVSNPEFLAEGSALADFQRPDRIILGGSDAGAMERVAGLFAGVGAPVLRMDRESAELSKYASNAMLAVRISFMNELSRLCEQVGADVTKVGESVGLDHRIGPAFLRAGAGFGGSCFPKDLSALEALGMRHGVRLGVVEAASLANVAQRRHLAQRVIDALGEGVRGARVALWGLAFKPGTDDLREASAGALLRDLIAAGAEVVGWDPVARPGDDPVFSGLSLAEGPLEAVDGADALVLVTEWDHFLTVDPEEVSRRMRGDLVFDGRNALKPDAWTGAGLRYRCVGRPALETE